MKKLSIGQFKAASEILGNIAVAWFTAGVISPIFVGPGGMVEIGVFLVIGLGMSIVFTTGSLWLVKGIKS